MYHSMCFKGNYECLVAMLCLERTYFKKRLYDELQAEKNISRLKNMDVKHGALDSSLYQDDDLTNRFEKFIISVSNMFSTYAKDLVERYGQIFTHQDTNNRNPIHYGAMSKYTKCYKTL